MRKNSKKKKGNLGEDLGVEYLKNLNFSILDRNWRYHHWEIDIIAKKDSILVFFEIKTREKKSYIEEVSLVSKKQQKTIFKAAAAYMQKISYSEEFRFDVLAIILNNTEVIYHHYEDAFFPEWE